MRIGDHNSCTTPRGREVPPSAKALLIAPLEVLLVVSNEPIPVMGDRIGRITIHHVASHRSIHYRLEVAHLQLRTL